MLSSARLPAVIQSSSLTVEIQLRNRPSLRSPTLSSITHPCQVSTPRSPSSIAMEALMAPSTPVSPAARVRPDHNTSLHRNYRKQRCVINIKTAGLWRPCHAVQSPFACLRSQQAEDTGDLEKCIMIQEQARTADRGSAKDQGYSSD